MRLIHTTTLLLTTGLCLLLLAGPTAAAKAPAEPSDQLVLQVRDAMTGIAVTTAKVAGTVEDQGKLAPLALAGAAGLVSVERGMATLQISADGYRSMTIPGSADKAGEPVVTVWLTPETKPEVLDPEMIQDMMRPGFAMLHGHVVDVERGVPVAGAEVRVAGTENTALTDQDGYFYLYEPAIQVIQADDVPSTADLVISADGFAPTILKYIALIEEDCHFIVDLERGEHEVIRDMSHKMFPQGRALLGLSAADLAAEPELAASGQEPVPMPWDTGEQLELDSADTSDPMAKATFSGLQVYNPIDSIYVSGYGWFYLEVYVARGLCNEWISSWNYDSLFAGSIAYRSYGTAYYLSHGYVCATTSCQVFKNTTISKCSTAAERTAGILLQKGGSIAAAEYSAENNCYYCSSYSCVNYDRSCGYGYAGSPAYHWPCLSDSHSFSSGPGACCFGHGRGMCQWGTQAWGNAAWKWNKMVDHYFNASGAGSDYRTMYMTSPLELVSASPSPSSVAKGSAFTINATIRNYADYAHQRLMVGASIVGPGSYSDPAHDKKVTAWARSGYSVQYRDTAVSRSFTVPSYAPGGYYNLMVAIWYDTDDNNQITSSDKMMRLVTYTNAVYVY